MDDKAVSIFNDVLGPVMRGPSSSHTAGSYRIGLLVRELLDGEPASAIFRFDPDGSYAQVYREQGSDLALAAGLMGWSITDARFEQALEEAATRGLYLEFSCEPLAEADHPNTVEIEARSRAGTPLRVRAKSVGGGRVVVDRLDDWSVALTGTAHELIVACDHEAEAEVHRILAETGSEAVARRDGSRLLLHHRSPDPPGDRERRLRETAGVIRVWSTSPLFLVERGVPSFRSAAEMIAEAERTGASLGRIARASEAKLLETSEDEVQAEVLRRFAIMREAVRRGLEDGEARMQLLPPSAGGILRAESEGRLAQGGLHTRAAARAMAAMHATASGAVVCAAPTGGAAGVLPGVLVTLAEEHGLDEERIALALLAAGAIGVVVAERATFAAEEAGCQVEIGAAGAMAAAAVVEAAGGDVAQAADAAAISFQNTMGSVCDLVQGIVEIPCHTRNAVAASSAFVCADLILGGYRNPVPLDETVDAVLASGRMLPAELRCTARGGLAVTPSARDLKRRR